MPLTEKPVSGIHFGFRPRPDLIQKRLFGCRWILFSPYQIRDSQAAQRAAYGDIQTKEDELDGAQPRVLPNMKLQSAKIAKEYEFL